MMTEKNYTLGIIYWLGPETEMLTQKIFGNLINDDKFCKACELLEQNVKCDNCSQ